MSCSLAFTLPKKATSSKQVCKVYGKALGCKLYQNKRLTWVEAELKPKPTTQVFTDCRALGGIFSFFFPPMILDKYPSSSRGKKIVTWNWAFQKMKHPKEVWTTLLFWNAHHFGKEKNPCNKACEDNFPLKNVKSVRNKQPLLTRGWLPLDMCKWWIFSNQTPQVTMYDVLSMK
jgi:hypothetical protein